MSLFIRKISVFCFCVVKNNNNNNFKKEKIYICSICRMHFWVIIFFFFFFPRNTLVKKRECSILDGFFFDAFECIYHLWLLTLSINEFRTANTCHCFYFSPLPDSNFTLLEKEFHLSLQKLCTYFVWSGIWESHNLIGILLGACKPCISAHRFG